MSNGQQNNKFKNGRLLINNRGYGSSDKFLKNESNKRYENYSLNKNVKNVF